MYFYFRFIYQNKSLKFKIDAINKKISSSERNRIIDMYGTLGYENIIFEMKNPEQVFTISCNPQTQEYYFGFEIACINWKTTKRKFFKMIFSRQRI